MKPVSLVPAIIIASLLLGGASVPNSATAEDADTVMRKVAASLKPRNSFSVLSKVDTYRNRTPAGSMTLRTYIRISRSDRGPHSLSVVLQPRGERGKVFLRAGEALWLYDPGAERPVKLSAQQRLMGDASLADVTHFDLEENYRPVLEGRETVADSSGQKTPAYRLRLNAKSKNALYPTLRLWADEQRTLPVKVDCLSSTGQVLKTVYYGRFQGFLGRPRPTELDVVDGTAPGRVTRIRFSQFQLRELDDSSYTTGAMPSISRWADSDRAVR